MPQTPSSPTANPSPSSVPLKAPRIGLVGATGLVGSEILQAIASSSLPISTVRLYASRDSVGEVYRFRAEELEVAEFSVTELEELDVLVWASTTEVPADVLSIARRDEVLFIDLGTSSQGDLYFPEGRLENVGNKQTRSGALYALPSPTSLVVRPLIQAFASIGNLSRVVVTTFESVAGARKEGLDELWGQGLAVYNQKAIEVSRFAGQIAFNCLPQIHILGEDGRTREEHRVEKELATDGVSVTVTAVRVPVFHGLAASVTLIGDISDEESSAQRFQEALRLIPSVAVQELGELPTHLDAVGTEEIQVGRIRAYNGSISAWVVADGVLLGAVAPVVEILKRTFPPS